MENNSIIKACIIGVSAIATAFVLGQAIKKRNTNQDVISVTGLGTKDFISDEILFTGSFSAKGIDGKSAYNTVLANHETVKNFFLNKGFTNQQINFTGVELTKNFREQTLNEDGRFVKTEQVFDGYTATQKISISALKNPALMQKIEAVSSQTSELINSGIELNMEPLHYTYSDLPNLKHSLIAGATTDAMDRAKKIVKAADGEMGKLKKASMGVFQITGKGDVEEDSYGGNNDIFNKDKTARITVRLEYELE